MSECKIKDEVVTPLVEKRQGKSWKRRRQQKKSISVVDKSCKTRRLFDNKDQVDDEYGKGLTFEAEADYQELIAFDKELMAGSQERSMKIDKDLANMKQTKEEWSMEIEQACCCCRTNGGPVEEVADAALRDLGLRGR